MAMTSEFLLALSKVNLAAAAAILAVILLRRPVRAMFGARLAYLVWLIVPAAAIAVLIPARTVIVEATLIAGPAPVRASSDPWAVIGAVWVFGAVAFAVWLVRRQLQFLAEARRGRAGPAVVGILRPRIVTPSDFEQAFNAREREVILAHERTHIARADTLMNSLAALVQCLCWFNPLIHVGAYLMRIDQELACDAQVVERHPKARRTYAAAMLKAELADRPLPLGCYWPAGTLHPLTKRVAMLKHETPGALRRAAGAVSLIALFAGAGFAAWAAQPDRIEYVEPQKVEAPRPAPVQDGFVDVRTGKPAPVEAPKPAPKGAGKDGFVPVPVEKPVEEEEPSPPPPLVDILLPVAAELEPVSVEEEELPPPRVDVLLPAPGGEPQHADTIQFVPSHEDQPAPPPSTGKLVEPPKTEAEVQRKVDVLRSVEKKKLVDTKLIKGPKKDLPPEMLAKLKEGKQLSPEVAAKLKEGKKELPPEVIAKLKKIEESEGPAAQPKKPN
jgi:beta-lactamase regulating signal transducer with metallopeptidase domain